MAEPTNGGYWKGTTDAHVEQLYIDVAAIKADVRKLVAAQNRLYGAAAATSALVAVVAHGLWWLLK
mgnify:CR=1 FL=1